jgi:hypothetical protein
VAENPELMSFSLLELNATVDASPLLVLFPGGVESTTPIVNPFSDSTPNSPQTSFNSLSLHQNQPVYLLSINSSELN